MRNLIRAIAKLPGRKLRQLIRAGRIDAKVRWLESRLAAVRKDEARLLRRLAAAAGKLEALLGGSGPKRRGPGRPRTPDAIPPELAPVGRTPRLVAVG